MRSLGRHTEEFQTNGRLPIFRQGRKGFESFIALRCLPRQERAPLSSGVPAPAPPRGALFPVVAGESEMSHDEEADDEAEHSFSSKTTL